MAQEDTHAHAPVGPISPPAEAAGGSIRAPQIAAAPNAAFPMFPAVYPAFLPGMSPMQGSEEQDQGPGIYAIPCSPLAGAMAGYPPNMLIPLTYKIPTRENNGAAAGEEQGQEARQQHGPQRQVVVRRFHFAFQLDLALIIKLAAVVFLFSQEGSKQRLIVLVFFASLVYLYQTGAITPLLRWLQRAGFPRPPQPPAQAENRPPVAQNDGNDQPPEGNLANPMNPNQVAENQEPAVAANENHAEPEAGANRGNWVGGILKEIQMFVVGFVASLLPGFQHND